MKAVLTHNDLNKALDGKSKKPDSMNDEEWEELDEKEISAIQLSLSKEAYDLLNFPTIGQLPRTKLEGIVSRETNNVRQLQQTEYAIPQKVCCNIRDFHGLILNGYIEREIVEYVLPQLQRMAEKVMQICYTNLKDSTSAEVGCFIKNLLEISPDILREYLIHLQEHMVTFITTTTPGAQNIHVMIEFLLIILTDVPKDFIHHDKLFDLLACVGALIREVSTLVRNLEEKSRNEESNDETSRATLDLLEEKIELLKEDLKNDYLKAPDSFQCFPMSDGSLFMHLLLIHLNDLLDSNSYSIALIKDEITLMKETLEFIRLFFVNVEQGLYKDPWARVLDVAYEAKDVIDSIIVRANGLLHLIFSLPITMKKIKLIKEDASQLSEKIPKNKSLIAVNSPKNPVERKSLTTSKIIVGFKEETNWLISKLTSGPKDLDVISITGMPGSGKTTLAYKVYNDESVCSHFDLRAWCTVNQDYEEKKLLMKLFNQVTGSDLKFSEDIDVADELRRKLHRKRYLIVLDDVWDIDTWDDLTRPFHGKSNTDPLNLRSLRPEERREKTTSVWHDVRNNLNSFIFGSEVDVMKVIELSYGHLPLQLKPCFLYLARYPKDREIYRGDDPTCQLHDLVHDFCLIKAKEEKLFEQQISSSDPSFSSSDLMPRMVNISYNKEQFGLNNFILFISKMKKHSCKSLCSLEITGDEMEDRLSDSCHLRDLRLLRVLILFHSFMMVKDSLLNEICMLNHLRFLRIGTEVKSLPSSFSNLWNLETLLVDNKLSTLVLLPRIWAIVKLRVLCTHACSFFDLDIDEPILIVEDLKLENLRICECCALMLSYSKETEDFFIRFPNLQRLVFDLKESWDYSPELYWFPNLDFLHELETLEVVFESSITNDNGPSAATNWTWDFHFPSNLKILSLLNFPLTSDSLSIIARLPNLEHLFLTRTIIKWGEWNMREEDTLENLKFLMLDNVTLAKWEFGEESFPMLEKLQLWGCHMLEEIPSNFGDIGSLKIIQLVESPQLENSEIKEYVEDIMGWDLEAQFTPPSWRAAAMPSTGSFLLPNASDFNCNNVTEEVQCNKKWDTRSAKSLNCDHLASCATIALGKWLLPPSSQGSDGDEESIARSYSNVV
ncbi:putative lysine-specific demethylase JMJ14-like [Capsicum annuum]|nr:putative lysine-specific demethylase JMJ14-like [Capsicum annuum]